jgi:hypothetical protein
MEKTRQFSFVHRIMNEHKEYSRYTIILCVLVTIPCMYRKIVNYILVNMAPEPLLEPYTVQQGSALRGSRAQIGSLALFVGSFRPQNKQLMLFKAINECMQPNTAEYSTRKF